MLAYCHLPPLLLEVTTWHCAWPSMVWACLSFIRNRKLWGKLRDIDVLV